MRRKVCAFVFVRGPPAKVLLLHRAPGTPRGGWHPVTGHVEPEDPSLAAAAAREVVEETAFTGRLLALRHVARYEQDGPDGPLAFEEHAFGVELPESELPELSAEHTQAAWLTFEEARRRLTFRTQADALAALERALAP